MIQAKAMLPYIYEHLASAPFPTSKASKSTEGLF